MARDPRTTFMEACLLGSYPEPVRKEMAEPIRRFREQFAALKPEPGAVVSLAPASRPLGADARLLCIEEFLAEVVNQGVSS